MFVLWVARHAIATVLQETPDSTLNSFGLRIFHGSARCCSDYFPVMAPTRALHR